MAAAIEKAELVDLLYEFLDAIYLFQKKEEGLFDATWQDIFLLKRLSGAGMTVGEVARELRLPLFSASRLVARLEGVGLVTKLRDEGNRRIIHVAATAEGKSLLRRVEDYQCELLGRNLGLLESDEVASMAAAIRKLRTLLEIE